MIEDKEDGIKIAENSDEVYWLELKNKILKDTEMNKRAIIINKHIIKLCDKKLKPFSKA